MGKVNTSVNIALEGRNVTITIDGLDTVARALGDLQGKSPTAVKVAIEPFPKKRTQKAEKKRKDPTPTRSPDQAAEAHSLASKQAGAIQPKAECGRTVL